MLKTRERDIARVGIAYTISMETSKRQLSQELAWTLGTRFAVKLITRMRILSIVIGIWFVSIT